MRKSSTHKHSLEVLESRIAPASIPLTAKWVGPAAVSNGFVVLEAGTGLSTSGAKSGDYLLYVEKGAAAIFTTDLNNNGAIDFNEITGISASDGLRLISFVDIHGDIVTNLKVETIAGNKRYSLSDSNNDPADDPIHLGGDGRVLLNSRIEKIEMRTLTTADLPNQNDDNVVNNIDVDLRRAPTSHSIFGNIYAGAGFGVASDPTSGLVIDTSVVTNFGFEGDTKAMIGSIRVGTAASGEYFRFSTYGGWESTSGEFQQRVRNGVALGDDAEGYIVPFVPGVGQAGASISWVRSAAEEQTFNINGLYAGNGGPGAAGGNILDVTISGDDSGGYQVIAGNGGSGTKGGAGGSILRFSDSGSITGQVTIRTGSGGNASTGAGGNGGGIDIVKADFYGDYSILMGNGGDGFTQGGLGASISKATITEPTPVDIESGNGVGTSHSPSNYRDDLSIGNPYTAAIGTTQAVDFDGDGLGDFVVSSAANSQLIVYFGNNQVMYLASPRNGEALVVADLNADGRPDIAAASADLSSHAGVAVFISKWNDSDGDGDINGPEDTFLGFYDPRYSPLPQVGIFAPHQITELAAGDFDGDGANELAVIAQGYRESLTDSSIVVEVSDEIPRLFILSPDREFDNVTQEVYLTGHFYADFGPTGTIERFPVLTINRALALTVEDPTAYNIVLDVTAINLATSVRDSLILGVQGNELNYWIATLDYYNPTLGVTFLGGQGGWIAGAVDTNREPATTTNPNVSDNEIGMLDFVVSDYNGDGLADLFVLSDAPSNFVVGLKGNGSGVGQQTGGNGIDQSGWFIPDESAENAEARGIKTVDIDGDGAIDDFVVIYQTGGDVGIVGAIYQEGPSFDGFSGPIGLGSVGSLGNVNISGLRSEAAIDGAFWDVYYPVVGVTSVFTFGIGAGEEIFGLGITSYLTGNLRIIGGEGGDSFAGKAGNGGSIGGKGKLETTIDPVTGLPDTDLTGAISIDSDEMSITLRAGDGGLGFSRGGNGGAVAGVTVRMPRLDVLDDIETVLVQGGHGGRGISGAGGAGGDLIANSIDEGRVFFAGNGGDGKVGGRGGSVIGNALRADNQPVFDTDTDLATVAGGLGGSGIRGGGAGGNIVNFTPFINGGSLTYNGGAGGDAISGAGGAGGSVINSSPGASVLLEGRLAINSGAGGDGATGGAGGNITKFNLTVDLNSPRIMSFVAGDGGRATKGTGGRGGSIGEISAFAAGDIPIAGFNYSRFVAGNGGESTAGRGGAGGGISNVVTGVSAGSIALVSGAGGNGLYLGGAGGNVGKITFDQLPTGTDAKALIVAGQGGNARAFLPNPADQSPDQGKKAFGGRIGQGGAGGNIDGIFQNGTKGAHFDLIAGNGGDTIYYGSLDDVKTYVGRGGSIRNVNILGDAGNYDAAVAIKSYNDILNGETMQQFVDFNIRTDQGVGVLTDAIGNVGIVVGSAGRNKAIQTNPQGAPDQYETQPSEAGRNGDLINFTTAGFIMSAVAGSVDRLATIQLAQNIHANAQEDVGAPKNGAVDYLDENGKPTTVPVRDGRLVDGAFITDVLRSSSIAGNISTFPD